MSTTTLVTDTFASFDQDWRPEPYLHEYYTHVQHDEEITLGFLTEAAALIGDVPVLLDFGCGPTVHHLFPFAGTAATIEVADYLPCNLHAVQRWINGDADAWDWSAFAAHTLRIERRRTPMQWEVDDRQAAVRERVTAFHLADARRRRPLATSAPHQWDEAVRASSGIRLSCAASAPTRSPVTAASGNGARPTSRRSWRPEGGSCWRPYATRRPTGSER